jgi:twitching motility protein PilJ
MAIDSASTSTVFTRIKTWVKPATHKPEGLEAGADRWISALIWLALISNLAAAVFVVRQIHLNEAMASNVNDVQVSIQQMTKEVLLVAQGDKSAVGYLKNAEARVAMGLASMQKSFTGTPVKMIELHSIWDKLRTKVAPLTVGQTTMDSKSLKEVTDAGDSILKLTYELTDLNGRGTKAITWFVIAIISGLLALMLSVIRGWRQAAVEPQRFEEAVQINLQNQEAVYTLLNEIDNLANGDLTVKANVSENITGAIADSINYTIESLRALVVEINRASEQVNQATLQAQDTSASLLLAAEQQSQQIVDTSAAVDNMTRSILEVSSNAGQASQVAQQSLLAATQGAQAVQNTILGMNEIRTQIQGTSKRIKRLGESSQEISEIVELISDITEQTNILALNAAIQAASAGEAGRGFTVVAEEVQRLAERSSEATKQISAIVKTIQADTNSAVAAMEKSTEGVVEGAKLSDAAGQALNEIETVTNHLAHLIDSISTATVGQSEMASLVSRNMQDIQNITALTTDGTEQTAQSVGQLSSLAEELRDSVASFKLV